jgi:hypothetical protein
MSWLLTTRYAHLDIISNAVGLGLGIESDEVVSTLIDRSS